MAHVATLATFFAQSRLHNLKLSPNKSRVGAARVDFLGHVISQDGVRLNDDKVAALAHTPLPRDIKQLRSLLGGLSYYRKFLPKMAKRVRSIPSLLKKRAVFDFTPPVEAAVRALLAALAAPPILVFPDWDAVIDKSRPFRLHCDARITTLEQEQLGGSIRPIVYNSRTILSNERNWTPMELEAGCVVWSIRRLRRYLFIVFFLIFTDHECLQQISKIGESKPRIQPWMEFLSAYNYRLSYRRGRDNANADFLSRLPIPLTAEDISGSSALTDPDDLDVYLIRACGYTTTSCPIPVVGLGGLTPPSDNNLGTGWNPSPTRVLGGLPLTKDDFRTHRAPMPLRRRAGLTADTSVHTTNGLYLFYAIDDQLESSWPNGAGRTRSRTAILSGNTPLPPDYHRAARRGLATPAAPALPPKTPPRSSPLPRSDRLGSTSPLGRPGLCRPPPPPKPQIDTTPTASHTTPEYDASAATKQLSNTLLSYSHRDWDKAQRADPLCDATRRYIQLDRPDPPPRSLCDHLPSHKRPEIADITDLAAKGHLLGGDDDAILLVRKPITIDSTPDGHNSHRRRRPFDDPVRIYVPLLARPWIMHACHAEASCHLGVTRTLKRVERSIGG